MNTPNDRFRLAVVQMDVLLGDIEYNLATIAERARAAAASRARLVVFPECAVTGYCVETREEACELAQPIPGPVTERLERIARELDLTIVCGLIECDGEALYNALALVAPIGLVATYRKTHIPGLGLDRFVEPGAGPLAVHDLPLCKLGMTICYDGGFPETARVLALRGAELIVLPTNWPSGAEEFAEYAIATRGMENVVFYAAANRVGEERGFRFIGRSRIVDVHGRTLAVADASSETILTAEIDPALAREKKIVRVPGKHSIDRFRDRRPDLYGPIVE